MKRPLQNIRPIGPFASLDGRYILDITKIGGGDGEDSETITPDGPSPDISLDKPNVFDGIVTSRKAVTVPLEVRNLYNMQQGDFVEYTVYDANTGDSHRFEKRLSTRNTVGISTRGGPEGNPLNLEQGDRVIIEIHDVEDR